LKEKTTENLVIFPGNDCQAGDTFTLFRFLKVCANKSQGQILAFIDLKICRSADHVNTNKRQPVINNTYNRQITTPSL
jgi:hypothetical protein